MHEPIDVCFMCLYDWQLGMQAAPFVFIIYLLCLIAVFFCVASNLFGSLFMFAHETNNTTLTISREKEKQTTYSNRVVLFLV